VRKAFQSVQANFVKAIKDPLSFQASNDDEARRMDIYQSLFFNNIDNFISTGFPVLKSIVLKRYGEHGWESLVRQFFIAHECRSPYFAEISKEFVEYLSTQPSLSIQLPEFSAELAHYEWLELDVSIRTNVNGVMFYREGDKVENIVVSPYASLTAYSYPVHLIGDDYIPDEPASEQQFYVVYRDSEHHVQFAHLNPVSAMLINTLEQYAEGIDLASLGELMHSQLPQIPKETLQSGLHQTVNDMLVKNIFVLA